METTEQPTQPASVEQRLAAMEAQLQEVADGVQKIRSHMFWSAVGTFVFFVLPLIGAGLALPWMISQVTAMYSGLQ